MRSRPRSIEHAAYVAVLALFYSSASYAVTVSPDTDPDAKRIGSAAPVVVVTTGDTPLPEAPKAPELPEGVSAADDMQDAELLVLRITSEGYLLSPGASAYEIGDTLFISLADLVGALSFQIEVYDAEKRAEGWFLEEDNHFLLDITGGKLAIRGGSQELSAKDYRYIDNEIFIRTDTIKQWFGVDSTLNYSQLKLEINAGDKLAFKDELERQARWQALRKTLAPVQKEYPDQPIPYEWADFPSLTVQLGTGYNKSDSMSTVPGDYFVQGAGDLLKMSSEFFIGGGAQSAVNEARIRLYRYDEGGDVFPGLDVTEFQVGDIAPANLNFLGGGGSERGVGFTNRKADDISTPDNIMIDGVVEPGWEVELYRNGEFLGFQNSSQTQTGRYEFTGLSLDSGNNLFKIIFYGPKGEKKAEYRRFFLGDGMLKQGELNYDFSLTQPDQQVIPMDASYGVGGAPRAIAAFEYGITEDFSLGTGMYSGPIFNNANQGALFSSRASLLGVFNRVDHLHNSDNSSITSLSQRTDLFDFNFGTFFVYNHGFSVTDNDLEFLSSFNVSRQLDLWGQDIALRVGADYETFQTEHNIIRLNNQVSTSVLGSSLSNKISWLLDSTASDRTKAMDGEIFFRRRFDDYLLSSKEGVIVRANLDYALEPDFSVRSLSITAERNLTADIRLRTGSIEEFKTQKHSYIAALSLDEDFYSIQTEGKIDSDRNYAMGVSLRFHLSKPERSSVPTFRPLREAQGGSAIARVFEDKDNDGTFNEDDTLLPNVRLSTQDGVASITGEDGQAELSGLTAWRRAQMSVDQGTLPDIFLVSVRDGVSFVPRPATGATFDFPIVVGGEIDGTLRDEATLAASFDDIVMELRNPTGEVVKTVKADSGGYYQFVKIRPGQYTVAICPASVQKYHLTGDLAKSVEVKMDEPMVNGLDLQVHYPNTDGAPVDSGSAEPPALPDAADADPHIAP